MTQSLFKELSQLFIDLFTEQGVLGFAPLIASLSADKNGLGRIREARRGREGIGGARRRVRQQAKLKASNDADNASLPIRPPTTLPDPGRFLSAEVLPGYPSPEFAPIDMNALEAVVTVYCVLGAYPSECPYPEDPARFSTLLRNRYVRYWIYHNQNQDAYRLIAILASASASASAHDKGIDIVLPDMKQLQVAAVL